jgi:hypothetical protein
LHRLGAAGALVAGALLPAGGCEVDVDLPVAGSAIQAAPKLRLVLAAARAPGAADLQPIGYGEDVETKDILLGVFTSVLVTWVEPEWP